jgi:hypothetical protein
MNIKSSDTENKTSMTKHLNHPVMVEVFDVNLKKDDKMVELMSAKEAREVSSMPQWEKIIEGIHSSAHKGYTWYYPQDILPENVKKLKSLGYKVTLEVKSLGYKISWRDGND